MKIDHIDQITAKFGRRKTNCNCVIAQRDLYSAYLASFVENNTLICVMGMHNSLCMVATGQGMQEQQDLKMSL